MPPHEYTDISAEASADMRMLVWVHPKLPGPADGVCPPSMDHVFLQSILGYVSDLHEGKGMMDVLLVMPMQHESNMAPVMLPTWTLLGSVRSWLSWKLQGMLAAVARWQGKTAVIEKYVGQRDYQDWLQVQGRMKTS